MKNYWNIALGYSFLLHTVIMTGLPAVGVNKVFKPSQSIKEVLIPTTVIRIVIEKKDIANDHRRLSPGDSKQPIEKLLTKDRGFYLAQNQNLLEQDVLFKHKDAFSLDKAVILEVPSKEVILDDVSQDTNLKNNPAYKNYGLLIREKIRNNAQRYYKISEVGDIDLFFIVQQDGHLEDFHTTGLQPLREIVARSLKDAVPFPPFPKELKGHNRLDFKIVVHFKK
jgi:hypothetical protein